MTTTTNEGFNTISQSGSNASWTGLSTAQYPTEGTAQVALTAATQKSNWLKAADPQEASSIPVGATFDSMRVSRQVKKTGATSSSTNVTWTMRANLSSGTVSSYTQSTDEAWSGTINADGDRSYWKMTAYTPTQIIDKIKDGTLYIRIEAESTVAVNVTAQVKELRVEITYTSPEGQEGSLIAALV